VDGCDSRFGKLNKPLSDDAYKAAGIDGYLPPQPFVASRRATFSDDDLPQSSSHVSAASHLIDFGVDDDGVEILHFPTLWELNSELGLCDESTLDTFLDDHSPLAAADAPTLTTVTPTPTASQLAAKLVASTARLFFISWKAPGSSRREWHLVQAQLDSSLSLNPGCLHNGKYLVHFFIIHPSDKQQHPRNQRWWLEYHPSSSIARIHQGDYHLLRPDSYASVYAKENYLHPFCQWVNLLHESTYIHGPFEFATINGRITRDRISDKDWQQLSIAHNKYDDTPPDLDRPDFTGIQFSRNYHTSVTDAAVHSRILATRFTHPETYSITSLGL
jgi:hypothetical protein